MNRAIFLPAAAGLLLLGCHTDPPPPPCDLPVLTIYWDACNDVGCLPPQAGFRVPGLPGPPGSLLPAQLDCTSAGVDAVQLYVSGVIVACPIDDPAFGGLCVDRNSWLCTAGGARIPVTSGGSFPVEVLGYDSAGGLKYRSLAGSAVVAAECGETVYGEYSWGVDGPLGIAYALDSIGAPAFQDCSAPVGSDGTFMWFQVTAPTTEVDEVGRSSGASAFTVTCGLDNPIPLFPATNGLPRSMPAGVYVLDRIEEVARFPDLTTQSIRGRCSPTSFVHAGNETTFAQALSFSLPQLSVPTCWP